MTDGLAASVPHRPRPLEGIRVADFTWALAGPFCARMMADMGAEVIKVEAPGVGDPQRGFPSYLDPQYGLTGVWIKGNAGKKCISVDLKTPEGLRIAHELVQISDVAIENFRPGVTKRLGIDYETLIQRNPSLIMCSISGYGQESRYAGYLAADHAIQAFSGFMSLNGDPEGPPVRVGQSIADTSASSHALAAILAALYYRERTGIGQYIDVSMYDCLVHQNDRPMVEYFESNGAFEPTRQGHWESGRVVVGTFRARDGWLQVTGYTDEAFARLVRALGRPDLATDERFATHHRRLECRELLYPIIEECIQGFASSKDAEQYLQEKHVMAARVRGIKEVAEDPHLKERELLVDVPLPEGKALRLVSSPFRFSNIDSRVQPKASLLGQDTAEVLVTLLGHSPEEVLQLVGRGVLDCHPSVVPGLAGDQPE